ncbi:MAG: CDP-glycerol glycerophosphotransferase family protein [Bacillota bacterium]|nr:CDP-glycerol glycerophosphotransferase family protein [Bacillota bacterium]
MTKFTSTILIKIIFNFAFYLFYLFPINKTKVSFASYRNKDIQGNLLFLYNEAKNKYPNHNYVFLFKKMPTGKINRLLYIFHLFRVSYHISTSKYFFIDDYYLPLYLIKPKKNTEFIQVWHGAGAFKTFGYSTINKKFGPSPEYLKHIKIHSNYTQVIVSTREVIPYYAEAFNINSEKILPLGLPRTDFFSDSTNKHNILKRRFLSSKRVNLEKKKVILFAPTYRGNGHNDMQDVLSLDYKKLLANLNDDYIIIINLHPYVIRKTQIDPDLSKSVFLNDNEFSIEELLLIADILLTDYSSIIFDYSLLSRPIGFFAPDLEQYEADRGFYFDYNSFVPGPVFQNTEQIISWINTGEFDVNAVKKFSEKYLGVCDGKVSERVISEIFI